MPVGMTPGRRSAEVPRWCAAMAPSSRTVLVGFRGVWILRFTASGFRTLWIFFKESEVLFDFPAPGELQCHHRDAGDFGLARGASGAQGQQGLWPKYIIADFGSLS